MKGINIYSFFLCFSNMLFFIVFFFIATKHLKEMLLKDDVPKTNTDAKKPGNLLLAP